MPACSPCLPLSESTGRNGPPQRELTAQSVLKTLMVRVPGSVPGTRETQAPASAGDIERAWLRTRLAASGQGTFKEETVADTPADRLRSTREEHQHHGSAAWPAVPTRRRDAGRGARDERGARETRLHVRGDAGTGRPADGAPLRAAL